MAARTKTQTLALALPERFKKATPGQRKNRLIVGVDGLEGSGKTHFALTAPGPIAYQNFDIGTEGVVEKVIGAKAVYVADYKLTLPAMGRDGREQEVIEEAIEQRAIFDEDYRAALTVARSVVCDTASELWALYRMAEFGRVAKVPPMKYEEVNTKYRELIRLGYEHDANLILIHRLKPVWAGSEKTGDMERAGFADTGYLTQVNLLLRSEPAGDGAGVRFFAKVTKCRPNADLIGMELEDLDFATLGTLVYPDTTPEDWE